MRYSEQEKLFAQEFIGLLERLYDDFKPKGLGAALDLLGPSTKAHFDDLMARMIDAVGYARAREIIEKELPGARGRPPRNRGRAWKWVRQTIKRPHAHRPQLSIEQRILVPMYRNYLDIGGRSQRHFSILMAEGNRDHAETIRPNLLRLLRRQRNK